MKERNKIVMARLTHDEYKLIKEYAEKEFTSVSQVIRTLVLKALTSKEKQEG